VSFKVHVVEEPWNMTTKLLLIESANQKTFVIYLGIDGRTRRAELSEHSAEEPPAFITLQSDLAREVFPAIIEGLAKKGFERPSESKIAGLYEAQSAHLKDLQTLVAARILKAARP